MISSQIKVYSIKSIYLCIWTMHNFWDIFQLFWIWTLATWFRLWVDSILLEILQNESRNYIKWFINYLFHSKIARFKKDILQTNVWRTYESYYFFNGSMQKEKVDRRIFSDKIIISARDITIPKVRNVIKSRSTLQ